MMNVAIFTVHPLYHCIECIFSSGSQAQDKSHELITLNLWARYSVSGTHKLAAHLAIEHLSQGQALSLDDEGLDTFYYDADF